MNKFNFLKKYNIHGIISISLIFISFGIGVVSIAPYSILLSIVALLIIVLAIFTVSIVYCSKCNCRDYCNHYIFGKISVLVSKKNLKQYNSIDMLLGVVLPLGIAIAFPQYWLFKNSILLICYWAIIAIAGLEVMFFVCPRCKNDKCSMCKNKLGEQPDDQA